MKTIRIISAAILLTLMASCSSGSKKETKKVVEYNTPEFKATIGGEGSKTSWNQGDDTGIFMVSESKKENNVRYTIAQGGKMTAAGTEITYPEGKADFKAYHPYKSEANKGLYNIDITDQKDLNALDLLYSDNAKGKSRKNKTVSLRYRHILSCLTINIEKSQHIEGEVSFDVEAVTTATFDILKNKLTPEGQPRKLQFNNHSAIVIPGTIVKITAKAGKHKEVKEIKIQADKKISQNIKIEGDDRDFTVNFGEAEIEDWTDGLEQEEDINI